MFPLKTLMMNLSIYKKMMLGFGVIIGIMIISSTYILFELNSVASSTKKILVSRVSSLEIARELRTLVQDENSYIEKYQISGDQTYFSLFHETSGQISGSLKQLALKPHSKENQLLVQKMQTAHADLSSIMQNTPDVNAELEQAKKKNIRLFLSALNSLIRHNQLFIVERVSKIESVTARSFKVALFLIGATLFFAITLALLITRTITRPIDDLIHGTRQIAKGNYDKIILSSRDEMALLADAVNDMSSKIYKTNELRTQMMQQISHEIKTPLQAILSAHDVLKAAGAVKEKQVHLLDRINRSVNTIAEYSRQYLDLARIRSGTIQYNVRQLDLADVVQKVLEEAKIIAQAKDIDLQFTSQTVPRIRADQEKLIVVVRNLITNAIKYTLENGSISVSVIPCDIGAQIIVADTGIGIDKEELDNIFIRFYQAKNIHKAAGSGSGVGLAIVKAYTEGHGGKVFVESRLDEGSCFTLQFPVDYRPQPATPDTQRLS